MPLVRESVFSYLEQLDVVHVQGVVGVVEDHQVTQVEHEEKELCSLVFQAGHECVQVVVFPKAAAKDFGRQMKTIKVAGTTEALTLFAIAFTGLFFEHFSRSQLEKL